MKMVHSNLIRATVGELKQEIKQHMVTIEKISAVC